MDMTMMPMPPIHCKSPRQSSRPGATLSSPVITVAPVVVRPDMLSKKASVNDNCNSPSQNGSAA